MILVRWGTLQLATDRATAEDFVFGSDPRSVDQWYREVSHGAFHWSGDVTPVLTLPDPGADCHTAGNFDYYYRLANAAKDAAQAAGFAVDEYPIRFIDFPDTGCVYHSLAQVGGPYVWSDDSLADLGEILQRYAAVHELGHALGLAHSNGRECGSETLTPSCLADASTVAHYAYAWDAMGTDAPGIASGAIGWFGAQHLRALGWFDSPTGPRWIAVSTSGTYRLAPIESSTTSLPQALVVDTATQQYWIESRAAIGQDAYLRNWPEATDGVLVSLRGMIAGSGIDRDPELLDMTPGSRASQRDDFLDAALVPGDSYTDVDDTFTITVDSISETQAAVSIAFGGVDDDGPTVVSPPTPILRAGRIERGKVPIMVTWRAIDPAGVCTSKLQQSVEGQPFTRVGLSDPSTQSFQRRVEAGSTYRYRVRAIDCLGNASDWTYGNQASPRLIEENDQLIEYVGQWRRHGMTGASNGHVAETTHLGATASISSVVHGVGLVIVRGPGRGDVELSLDGVVSGVVSLRANEKTTRSIVWHHHWPLLGGHEVTLVVVGIGGRPVELDAIVLL